MFYPDELIEEIREKNEIVDLIGNYVQLKQRGNNHFGLCPFHNEKTPSFSVNMESQRYYCFGCGQAGNVITFIMQYENMDFIESIKFLANRVGVVLPEAEMTPEERKKINHKKRLQEVNKWAARYYYFQLSKNDRARTYLLDRGLNQLTIDEFGLGYAPFYRDDLHKFLLKKGFTDEEMLDAGLIIRDKKNINKYYDRFFNRIIFPILDINKRVIAFGGRTIGSGEPKYLNSPETQLFNKSENLYGLYIARRSREKFLILVEGYMDVISLHSAGFKNVVAALGTSFTPSHAKLIKRYYNDVIISFDNDEAGKKAALRAYPIMESAAINVRVITDYGEKDPDDYIKKYGPDKFSDLLGESSSSFMFDINEISKSYNLKDPAYKARFIEIVSSKLVKLNDKIKITTYKDAIIDKYLLDANDFNELVEKKAKNIGIVKFNKDKPIKINDRNKAEGTMKESVYVRAEKELLSVILCGSKVFYEASKYISINDFTDERTKKIAEYIYGAYNKGLEPDAQFIIQQFPQAEDQSLVARIFKKKESFQYIHQIEKTLNDVVKLIKLNNIMHQSANITDPSLLSELIKSKNDLSNLHISLINE